MVEQMVKNVEDTIHPTVGENFICFLVLPEGVENQPWKELEAGLKIRFAEVLGDFKAILKK